MFKSAAVIAVLLLLPFSAAADESVPPGSFAEAPATESEGVFVQARELALHALGFIGVRYKFGGSTPETGFDCSGLIRYVYSRITGRALPGNAREISEAGRAIDPSELQPGDLVFFNTLRRPFSHVGIYLGDSRFVHAPSRGGAVEIVDMSQRYWKNRYNGARRLPI